MADNDHFSDPNHTVKEIKLPASVFSLHGFDFTGHRSLAVVDLSSTSIEKIGNRTFAGCKSLRTASLPKTCKELGLGAFFSCHALLNIDLSETQVTEIKHDTFNGCFSLETVRLPKRLRAIGEAAFFSCNRVVSIDPFPDTLVAIRRRAFAQCSGLASVDLSTTHVLTIGYGSFEECSRPCSPRTRRRVWSPRPRTAPS